jgi:hypothetical protein
MDTEYQHVYGDNIALYCYLNEKIKIRNFKIFSNNVKQSNENKLNAAIMVYSRK